ncbi:MAG: HAD-IB family phosphatase [Chitinophagaceae bacterium]|nr:HAD-IB family phosphatase [Chitinophagaceae bacterium]
MYDLKLENDGMVTVIIPALNQEETISEVVKFCVRQQVVSEVLVVDQGSFDKTAERAIAAGAKLLNCSNAGNGLAIQRGVSNATNQYLVFLDASITPLPIGTIRNLVGPLVQNECDLVKAAYNSNAGRVTELVAKPLLRIFFPELSDFEQPISAIMACKKSAIEQLQLLPDYGVSVGILIDLFLANVRIREVNIGCIENRVHPWTIQERMSTEISKTIIDRAKKAGTLVNLAELGVINSINKQLQVAVHDELHTMRKMIVFDMDNTLLKGRFIDLCASRFEFTDELGYLRKTETEAAVLTKKIARLLKGIRLTELTDVAETIPLIDDTVAVIAQLKLQGYHVGIISDSYQFVVDHVRLKIRADFSIGNQLEFFSGKATGEVTIPSQFYHHVGSKCKHPICKTNALMHVAAAHSIQLENCITIGDSENDLCMIEKAGMGIAFCTTNTFLRSAADKIIDKQSFSELLPAGIHQKEARQKKMVAEKTKVA